MQNTRTYGSGGSSRSQRRPSRPFSSTGPRGIRSGKPRPSFGGASRPGGFSSRSRFGGGPRGGSRGGGRRQFGQRLDVSLFVNKAVVVEETENHFLPEHAFADFAVHEKLKANIIKKGYTAPTPIQDRAIPHILNGRDVVGIANTGTGKTAAFLIPLIDKVLKNPLERVLIVVPTRELAIQIDQELKGFTPLLGIFSVCCVGGTNIQPQIRDLRHKNQFVIGTPGRLKDLIDRRSLDLSKTSTVVLDEADRMLDMGFIDDMRFLMERMPKIRHTLFFSATLSPDIEKLIGDFLVEPVSISVKNRDTSKNVDQDIVRMKPGQHKVDALQELLIQTGFDKVIVFGRTKHGVQKLSQDLCKRGFKADAIHGDKSHSQRQKALNGFKDGKVSILVATDVAARGLDIPNVSHVINFDIPATYDDYVHRIGRTGRANTIGTALTFVE
jgi:ATP-dependent RNA helicase RhlE